MIKRRAALVGGSYVAAVAATGAYAQQKQREASPPNLTASSRPAVVFIGHEL